VLAPLRWTAVVPLKDPTAAKQRLTALGDVRPALAAAFASDVLAAVLSSRGVDEVVVVGGAGLPDDLTGDPRVQCAADVRGLNDAVAAGMQVARRSSDAGVLVVPADLPCLRSSDVDLLLGAARSGTVRVLADAEADGTTAVVVAPGAGFRPAFGPGSYARHLSGGAAALDDALVAQLATARRDVDTVEHLRRAQALGVGAHTARVLADLDATPTSGAWAGVR